jgi:hypothetical protein
MSTNSLWREWKEERERQVETLKDLPCQSWDSKLSPVVNEAIWKDLKYCRKVLSFAFLKVEWIGKHKTEEISGIMKPL